MLLDEGVFIRDAYEIDRFLGEGAFAEVYRVKHKFLGRQAMKVFKSPSTSLEELEEKLYEARMLSKLGHPNIIRVFDAGVVGTSAGRCGYFTMEYVAGGSLEPFWRSHGEGFVPISDTLEIIRQVCAGLAVAHAEEPPIIHRDIKPQNILVGYDATGLRIRVADFGLAKKVNPLTLLASAKGTPAFKPPESLSNVDHCAADVWSIGATLYLLLTDRLPFPITNIMDFSSGKCWEHPLIPASRFNSQIDPALDSIVFRALSIKPADRYPNAGSMLNDVTRLVERKRAEVKPTKDEGKGADESKRALGSSSGLDRFAAETTVKRALIISQDISKLVEAADLLEEALNSYPKLREEYEYKLKLWRRGIVT